MNTPDVVATSDPVAVTLRSIAQNILVAVFGLLPIFFIPSGLVPFEYTKILVVACAVCIALMLFSLSALRAGGVSVGLSYTLIGMWSVAIVAIIASLVSGDVRDSFIGDVLTTQTSAFLLVLALIASAWVLVASEKQAVMRLYMLLALSTLVTVLFHIVRIVGGPDLLSFGVFGQATSSPVGGWNDLALFLGLAVLLSLIALDQMPLTRVGRTMFVVVTAAALIMLAVINFFMVWVVLGLASLVIVVYALTRDRMSGSQPSLMPKRQFNMPSFITAFVVFVVSATFVIGGSAIGAAIAQKVGVSYIEVRPSLQSTINVGQEVYRTNAFLGIGPNKFIDAWRLHKDPSINTSIFWNTDFVAGSGYVTTFFVTMGLFGLLAWLAFLVLFIITGVRMLVNSNGEDRMWYFIGVSSFVSGVYLWGMSLVYVPGAVMLMLAALCVGITLTAERALAGNRRPVLSLVTNRRTGFIFTLIVIAIIIGSIASMYGIGKHYAAVRAQNMGLAALSRDGVNASFGDIERAYGLYQSDVYVRRIGEVEYAKLNTLVARQNPTEQDRAEFTQVVQTAVRAAEQARTLDPLSFENATLVGNIYSLLLGANIEGVYDKAKEALSKARELNPKNPLAPLNLAVLEARAGNFAEARTRTEEAIALKPNFTEAYNFLAQIEIATGNVEGAIRSTASIIQLEPENPVRYYQLGLLEGARKNIDGSILAFEKAVSLDPNYANALYLLAVSYDAKGRKDDALAALEKVLALNPGNADVTALIDSLRSGGSIANSTLVPNESVTPPAPVTEADNGTVTTGTDPNTSIVKPVNIVPEREAAEGAPQQTSGTAE